MEGTKRTAAAQARLAARWRLTDEHGFAAIKVTSTRADHPGCLGVRKSASQTIEKSVALGFQPVIPSVSRMGQMPLPRDSTG